MTDQSPPPGEWKTDPTGRHQLRWWDGSAWSDHVSDGGAASTDPYVSTPSAPPPAAEPWVPPTPISPREDAAAGKRSRAPWVIGIVLTLVAAGVAVVLLAGGDDDVASGTGELAGEISSSTGRVVTREVSVPAGSALVIRVEPDEELDVVVSILCDEDVVDAVSDLAEPLAELDPDDVDADEALVDALTPYVGVSSAGDPDTLQDDGVEAATIDDLPPALLLDVDVGYEGEEEVIVFLAPTDADLTVAFTGWDRDAGSFDARLDIVDLGVQGDDADTWAEAVAANDELAELVR